MKATLYVPSSVMPALGAGIHERRRWLAKLATSNDIATSAFFQTLMVRRRTVSNHEATRFWSLPRRREPIAPVQIVASRLSEVHA
jgi:hypothetical protein